jgi:hypothetical protein
MFQERDFVPSVSTKRDKVAKCTPEPLRHEEITLYLYDLASTLIRKGETDKAKVAGSALFPPHSKGLKRGLKGKSLTSEPFGKMRSS